MSLLELVMLPHMIKDKRRGKLNEEREREGMNGRQKLTNHICIRVCFLFEMHLNLMEPNSGVFVCVGMVMLRLKKSLFQTAENKHEVSWRSIISET